MLKLVKSLKTILLYIAAIAGLIALSSLYTGRVEVVINPLPAQTQLPARSPNRSDCYQTARSFTHNYIPRPSPALAQARLIEDFPGEPLTISGVVYAADGVTPLSGAIVAVWHADAQGRYQQAGPGAQIQTDAEGRYKFTTVKPGHYRVGCQYLPAHIHYRVNYKNNEPLFLSLLFEGDPYLSNILITEQTQVRPLSIEQTGLSVTKFDIALPHNKAQP